MEHHHFEYVNHLYQSISSIISVCIYICLSSKSFIYHLCIFAIFQSMAWSLSSWLDVWSYAIDGLKKLDSSKRDPFQWQWWTIGTIGIIIGIIGTIVSTCFNHSFIDFLVGGWPTPLKNDGVKVSWDDDPHMMGKSFKIPWFQTTNHSFHWSKKPVGQAGPGLCESGDLIAQLLGC